MHISFDLAHTPFGTMIIAKGAQGLCFLSLMPEGPARMRKLLHGATFIQDNTIAQKAIDVLAPWMGGGSHTVPIAAYGTPFQLSIWQALESVRWGEVATYTDIAHKVGNHPRPVGQAVKANPLAFLIPCHRIIHTSGQESKWAWGAKRKHNILDKEQASCHRLKYG